MPADIVTVAVPFLWLGMVLAISFLEAPLKFRAPGITVPLGVGIGRLVFPALNLVEALLAAALVVAVLAARTPSAVWNLTLLAAIAAILAVQALALRPLMDRRAQTMQVKETVKPGVSGHVLYAGLELVKVIGLIMLGVAFLARLLP